MREAPGQTQVPKEKAPQSIPPAAWPRRQGFWGVERALQWTWEHEEPLAGEGNARETAAFEGAVGCPVDSGGIFI